MDRHRISVRVLALALSLAGCGSADDPVMATFEGGEVTQSEVDACLAGPRFRVREPRAVLLRIALTESLAAEAEARGLDERPELAIQLRRIEDRPWVGSLRARVAAESEPGEEAIAEYLEENRWRLSKPRKVRLWNILKRAPSDATPARREEVRRRMEAIRERLLAGEDFGELARRESEGVNAHRGGKMGAVPPGQLDADVEAVAFALEEGEITPVLDVAEGFVILRHAGIVEPTTMSEEEAEGRIRDAMRRWNREEALETLRAELFEEAAVALHEEALATARAGTVIGTIDGEDLTYGEIDELARSQGVGPQPARLTDARIGAVFRAHAFDRLAAARARDLGIAPSGGSLAQMRWRRRLLLADAELERRAREDRGAVVSDDDAHAYFSAHADDFRVPAQSLLSVIQLRLDDAEPETLLAQTTRARDALRRIRGGEIDFAQAARSVSEHPSASAGGDVGWKPRRWAASLGPNVLRAFDRLEPGQTTDVVRQDDLWILHLRDRRPPREPTFEEARETARRTVETQRLEARIAALRTSAAADVEATLEIVSLPVVPSEPDRGRRGRPVSPRAPAPDPAP